MLKSIKSFAISSAIIFSSNVFAVACPYPGGVLNDVCYNSQKNCYKTASGTGFNLDLSGLYFGNPAQGCDPLPVVCPSIGYANSNYGAPLCK
ncbi:hypothetical protein [Fluoribacter gormanii]|uniref:hypothetical protein n=1 Tax=Fluoribacter gormanii TaxID=464 RepID=UPI00104122B5|nr:hypothetical protein [Fluoribacter gormanii]